MRSRWIALLLVLSAFSGPSFAQIYVDDNAPGDPLPFSRRGGDPAEDGSAEHPFDGIQEAIDAAGDGETIIVAPGHYLSSDPWAYDEINFKGKSIRLISSAPTDFSVAEETILCGVIIFEGTESASCLLQGFKVQNHACGGILGDGTQARISHCIISGNGPCGATVLKDVQGEITNCLIVDNTTFHACGVLPVVSGCPYLTNCTISNNLSGIEIVDEGIVGADGSVRMHNIIENCIIYGNRGPQIVYVNRRGFEGSPLREGAGTYIQYSLIENWESLAPVLKLGDGPLPPLDVDPCFVKPGYWVGRTLIEGDYHLKSEGWRWSRLGIRGSHWYSDSSTSPATDAGDPIDGLGEEPERVPVDPAGRRGTNHAIDLGAYGGTTQASLAPTNGTPPGIGAVDLRDYLPFTTGYNWSASIDEGIVGSRYLRVEDQVSINGYDVYQLADSSPVRWRNLQHVYVNDVLYRALSSVSLNSLPRISDALRPQYPRYLTIGATIPIPEDPLGTGMSAGQPGTIVRGSLAEVLAGTDFDPIQFLNEPWPDVIALRETTASGELGRPVAILARGFGPLMLDGQPVTYAQLGNRIFVVAHTMEGITSVVPGDSEE